MAAVTEDFNQPDGWIPVDTFGSRLALVRQQMSWNVKEAAEACGVSGQSWHNWENGGMPRNLIAVCTDIASVSGCNYQWLVLGSEKCQLLGQADLEVVPPIAGQLELDLSGSTPERPRLQLVLGGVV